MQQYLQVCARASIQLACSSNSTLFIGIYAKSHYHDILANIDWLHGSAEFLLTVTNILIITGFRQSRSYTEKGVEESKASTQDVGLILAGVLAVISLLGSTVFHLPAHIEPSNALSLPTWMVHSSSILEWLIAMQLIWDHSYTANNPRWKGMSIAMIVSNVRHLTR